MRSYEKSVTIWTSESAINSDPASDGRKVKLQINNVLHGPGLSWKFTFRCCFSEVQVKIKSILVDVLQDFVSLSMSKCYW